MSMSMFFHTKESENFKVTAEIAENQCHRYGDKVYPVVSITTDSEGDISIFPTIEQVRTLYDALGGLLAQWDEDVITDENGDPVGLYSSMDDEDVPF